MHVVHEPCVPFVHPIYEPLRVGCKIEFHGHVEHGHQDNFAIELLAGPHIVLHANFRFYHHEHELVINAASHGNWGPEVRVHNPLHEGENFHICIHVHLNHYDIHVNGASVAEFHHRYPFVTVQAVGVKGTVHIHKMEFHGFHFNRSWEGDYDFGHSGYHSYGTDSYVAPQKQEGLQVQSKMALDQPRQKLRSLFSETCETPNNYTQCACFLTFPNGRKRFFPIAIHIITTFAERPLKCRRRQKRITSRELYAIF